MLRRVIPGRERDCPDGTVCGSPRVRVERAHERTPRSERVASRLRELVLCHGGHEENRQLAMKHVRLRLRKRPIGGPPRALQEESVNVNAIATWRRLRYTFGRIERGHFGVQKELL